MKYRRLLAPLGVLVAALVLATAAAAQTGVTVVASGLNNPRGLALGPNGELFVAEVGNGGAGPCAVAPGTGQRVCFGLTGGITRVSSGRGGFPFQERIASSLPSLGEANGTGTAGPNDIAFRGATIDATMGLGGSPAYRALFGPAASLLGHVVTFDLQGRPSSLGDIAAAEAALNPDGGEIDSQPYSLVEVVGGISIADAGANAIFRIEPDGSIRVAAVFPPRLVAAPPFLGLPPGAQIPMQAVPTSLTIGPDGVVYIGQLTGFPFPVGAANVYRRALGPAQPVTVFASGFTTIIDIAFGPDGSLYVLEFAQNGLLAGPSSRLIRVAPNGTRTTILDQGLVAATGLAIASNGDIYISNFGTSPTNGQVLLLRAPNTGDVDDGDND